jgi:hypothetical protein
VKVELVKATRGSAGSHNGLITFRIEVPIFVWVELLTHRRFSRNASSARAMGTTRYLDMGNYVPDTFYSGGKGMQSSDTPIKYQWLARFLWNNAFKSASFYTRMLEKLGVAKEQRNRLIPPTKYLAAIVTGTEGGWKHFLSLRNNPKADKAMQFLAEVADSNIKSLNLGNGSNRWIYSDWHIPYDPMEGDFQHRAKVASARIARVSYNRPPNGKDDLTLANQLLKDKHLSPMEHIAVFVKSPGLSALCCKPEDTIQAGVGIPASKYGWLDSWGWRTYRSMVE